MWLWMTLGWSAAAVTAATLHHRWRRTTTQPSPEVAAFLLRFENELAAHRDVEYLGLLPDRFACLLRVDGQETAVALHDVFRNAHVADDAFTRLVACMLADIREVGLDRVRDLDFAAAAPLLLPQVRSRQWLDQRCFGDSGLVHRRLNDELVTVYVVDDDTNMVFVCREHLRTWRKDVDDLHNLARANLVRRSQPALAGVQSSGQPVVLRSGDGFDAARVLLLDGAEGLLVAMPDRDTLWVGHADGRSLEQLMAATEAIAENAAHPVSPNVFRVTDGQLEPLPSRR